MNTTILAAYFLQAMTFWAPKSDSVPIYPEVATQVAEVVSSEAPVIQDHATTGVWLLGIAFHESGFARYVDEGRCNNREWRTTREGRERMFRGGHCDGGLAWSWWQIHPQTGVILTPDGLWHHAEDAEERAAALHGPDLVNNRRAAVRTALHMMRRALRAGNLCVYTGEPGPCPKAAEIERPIRFFLAKYAKP